MCKEEYQNPLTFKNRYKWFSDDLNFIKNRVQDNKLNNSDKVKGKYEFIVKFEIEKGFDKFQRVGYNEYMLDR